MVDQKTFVMYRNIHCIHFIACIGGYAYYQYKGRKIFKEDKLNKQINKKV